MEQQYNAFLQGISSFNELLPELAKYYSEEKVFEFVRNSGLIQVLTYGKLHKKAQLIAEKFSQYFPSNTTIILLYPDSEDFISAFLGCLYAGMIAVPLPIPYKTKEETWNRFKNVVANTSSPAIATTCNGIEFIQNSNLLSEVTIFTFDQIDNSHQTFNLNIKYIDEKAESFFLPKPVNKNTLAFLQYTSGSTGHPKGVMITHDNLWNNCWAIRQKFDLNQEDRGVSWLPYFHDMGLIGGLLQPIFSKIPMRIITPFAFIKRPLIWLKHITEFKATCSGAPSFAYELCCQKIKDDQLEKLDLSNWAIAFCGAEPIRVSILRKFIERFASVGFKSNTFMPCYGMAETTLMVTCEKRGNGFHVYKNETNEIASCGTIVDKTQIAIVDPNTYQKCPDDMVGEIWVRGPGVAQGYWKNTLDTEQIFKACIIGNSTEYWMRTGDLGFIKYDNLFVNGRIKETIIINGHNFYPSDIEETISRSDDLLEESTICVFSVNRDNQEFIVALIEEPRKLQESEILSNIAQKIRSDITEQHGIIVNDILFVKIRSILKTTSGKIQRNLVKKRYIDGNLDVRWNQQKTESFRQEIEKETSDVFTSVAALIVKQIEKIAHIKINLHQWDDAFTTFGLDSIQVIELIGILEEKLGDSLSPSLFYDYPSIKKLAQFLVEKPIKTNEFTNKKLANTNKDTEIAIVGIGVILPGHTGVRDFWEMLCQGQTTVDLISSKRWVEEQGIYKKNNQYVKYGSFFEDISQFDANFFNMNKQDALASDPQQRFLLETTQQALDDAGIRPSTLHGSKTGVYIGISAGDYAFLNLNEINSFSGLGSAHSIAANRLSYFYDLRGPSIAFDTACSSSLVAIDHAVQDLRSGRCDLAITGGVNITSTSYIQRIFTYAGMLSPDGKCKTFDEKADGYGRGEGCVTLVLKPIKAALADQDRIYAILVAGAENQDGKSNGITAPNGPSQVKVIEEALHEADITVDQIDYIEAHGTGTTLGDLIEFGALENVFSKRNRQERVKIGSVKTNIGHIEAAAGAFGVVKTALMLYYKQIVPHVNFDKMNSHIAKIQNNIEISDQNLTQWPEYQNIRYAGVSSFGFGGTNCHVILRDYQKSEAKNQIILPTNLLLISAHTPEAFELQLAETETILQSQNEKDISIWCALVNTRFDHQGRYRRFVIGQNKTELLKVLEKNDPTEIQQKLSPLVWVFPGQGTQISEMGNSFYKYFPPFRVVFDQIATLIDQQFNIKIKRILSAEDIDWQDDLLLSQFGIFAYSYALAQALLEVGLKPQAVIGHSLGEYCAAVIAGQLSVHDALSMLYKRVSLLETLDKNGAMAVICASESEIKEYIKPFQKINIAAYNSPKMITISGEEKEIEACLKTISNSGVVTRKVKSKVAFHSSLVKTILPTFEAWIQANITFKKSDIPLYNNIDNQKCYETNASYWTRQLRNTVLFMQNIEKIENESKCNFVDLSANGVMSHFIRKINPSFVTYVTSHQNKPYQTFLQFLGELWLEGHDIKRQLLYQKLPRTDLRLPKAQFSKKSYWPSDVIKQNSFNNDHSFLPQIPSNLSELLVEKVETTMPPAALKQERNEIKALIANELNMDIKNLEDTVSFLEIGADSLVLINVINLIKDRYNVTLPVQELYENLNTVGAIVDYIVQNSSILAEGTKKEISQVEVQKSQQIDSSIINSQTYGSSAIEQLFSRQLDVMKKQLELLQYGKKEDLPINVEKQSSKKNQNSNSTVPFKSSVHDAWFKRDNNKLAAGSSRELHIQNLASQLSAKTKKSKEYTQRYRSILADNRASAGFRLSTKELLYPIVGKKSEGSRFWDIDGNEYIDFTMGFGANLLGHAPQLVNQAIIDQFSDGIQIGPQSDLVGDVATLITELTGMDRVAFCNSGSEAVMSAIRLARAVTKKDKIVIFSGSYHGIFDGVLGRSNTGERPEQAQPIADGTPTSLVQDLLILEYGSDASLEVMKSYTEELAAVIVEPIQSRYPDRQPYAFLKKLRDFTQNYNVALIFDEVITGFRLASGGAQAYFDVKADIATYGKIVGGGMPIGALAGDKRFLDSIDGGFWQYGDDSRPVADLIFFAGTFSKHPLAMAASKATLTAIKNRPDLYDKLNANTTYLVNSLNMWFSCVGIPIEIVYAGSLFRFKYSGNYDILFHHLILRGFFIWEGRNCFISDAHTKEDIDAFIGAVKDSVIEMRSHGFFGENYLPLNSNFQASDAQQRFSSLAFESKKGAEAGVIALAITTPRSIDMQRAYTAWELIMARHDSLQMSFQDVATGKVTLPKISFMSQKNDVHNIPDILYQLIEIPFEISNSPLARMHILESEAQNIIVISLHHSIVDGWSVVTLIKEFFQIYESLTQNIKPVITASPSYKTFITSEKIATSETVIASLKRLADDCFNIFTINSVRIDNVQLYEGERLQISLDNSEIFSKLGQQAAKLQVTRFALLQAIFVKTLEEVTNYKNIPIAVPDAGRNFDNSMALVGQCIRLLPFCFKESRESINDLAQDVHKALLDQRTKEVVSYKFLRGKDAILPICAVFNVEPLLTVDELMRWDAEITMLPVTSVEFPIMVNLIQTHSGVNITLDFQYQFFAKDMMEKLLQVFSENITK